MKDIPGYEGLYAADENGVIWSLVTDQSRRRGPLKPCVNTGGYLRVNLFKDGKMKHEYVHRLVARAFVPNPFHFSVVNHIDADRQNNRPENLEWCSQRQNIEHSRKLGHQQKDRRVIAVSRVTGERREYQRMKDAGSDIFGKSWALNYHFHKKGPVFFVGDWLFEVAV